MYHAMKLPGGNVRHFIRENVQYFKYFVVRFVNSDVIPYVTILSFPQSFFASP
jgi:hypothetical protein